MKGAIASSSSLTGAIRVRTGRRAHANTQRRFSAKMTSGVTNSIGSIGQLGWQAEMVGQQPDPELLRPRLTSETRKKRPVVRAGLSRRPWPRKLQRLCMT